MPARPAAPVDPVTPTRAPAAPATVTATRADHAAVVSWSAAAPNGTPVTGYTVVSSPGGRSCTTSGATSCLVSGLANGTAYTFTVTATNAHGVSAPSDPSNTITPAAVPDAPTATTASRGDGQATVQWAEASGNGLPVLGYTVTSSPGGLGCSTGGGTSCVVSGLVNGTAYTFTVTATNEVGAGPASSPSDPVTPTRAPAAPATVTAAVAPTAGVGFGGVKLSWTAPSSNGSAITDYLVERSTDGKTWARVGDGVSTATTSTVAGLTNGTIYRFRIAAVNALGSGPWSATIVAKPVWKPAAPGGLRAVPASRRVTLSWTTPASNGSAITDYVIQRSSNGKPWTTIRDGVSTARSMTVTGLTNGVQYQFRVAAKNSVGVGPWSLAVRATPRAS